MVVIWLVWRGICTLMGGYLRYHANCYAAWSLVKQPMLDHFEVVFSLQNEPFPISLGWGVYPIPFFDFSWLGSAPDSFFDPTWLGSVPFSTSSLGWGVYLI